MSRIRADQLVNRSGSGGPKFPNGVAEGFSVSGIVTATSFAGNLTGNVTGNADTATTATNAQGLTGTPNITVGTVTGTDATFSGNLTVNGTTTTIDTAVTAVDSLDVDGSITALGNCGIGTASPVASASNYNGAALHLHQPNSSSAGSQVHLTNGTTGNAAGDGAHISMWSDSDLYITNQESAGDIKFASGGNSDRMTVSQHGMVKFGAPLTEKFHKDSGALTGDYNHDLITHGNVYWSILNSTGPFTFNLRGSASVSLDSMMSVGESLSFLLSHSTNNASNYMTAFKVDGNTLINGTHIWWQGGSAPSAAGTSGYDVYSFTLYKIAGASFRAFASLTNHA